MTTDEEVFDYVAAAIRVRDRVEEVAKYLGFEFELFTIDETNQRVELFSSELPHYDSYFEYGSEEFPLSYLAYTGEELSNTIEGQLVEKARREEKALLKSLYDNELGRATERLNRAKRNVRQAKSLAEAELAEAQRALEAIPPWDDSL